jgi:hypothetical protein
VIAVELSRCCGTEIAIGPNRLSIGGSGKEIAKLSSLHVRGMIAEERISRMSTFEQRYMIT